MRGGDFVWDAHLELCEVLIITFLWQSFWWFIFILIFRSSCYSHCCGCHCNPHFEYPSLPNSYFPGSTYDLNHCNSCGSCLRSAGATTTTNQNNQNNQRLFSKNRSSQRFIKQVMNVTRFFTNAENFEKIQLKILKN